MRKLASFSTRDTGVDRRTQPHSSFAASLISWTRRHRLGACIGILIAAAAAIAQQAYQGQTEWFDSVQQSMSEAMTQLAGLPSLPDQTRVDLMVGQPAHDGSVGKIAGEAGVSGGAATYSIPIVVPPGRRGLQPELSLSYSSRAGNGIAGMGWSLSGLSSLHRCPSTLEQDGIIRPVMLDASDKLCLDGQRLVVRSGTYGTSGATYATEIDSFARITQLAAGLASTAAYFKVELKSGEILYYGGNSSAADVAAQVVAGGVTLPTSWLLERKQDRVGNRVRYTYANFGNGEVLPSAIFYTEFGSDVGTRKVEFTYAARPVGTSANDSSSSYLAGGLTLQTQRLTYVTTKVGTQAVRQYRLAYQLSAASRRSLLASVTECAYVSAAVTCRPPTTFAWQAGPPAYQFKTIALGAGPGSAALALDRAPDLQPLGDFDGDGQTEVLWSQIAANGQDGENFIVSMTSLSNVRWAMPLPAGIGAARLDQVVADYDLDGKADLLGSDASGNYKIWFWHGPATATTFAQAFTESWDTGFHPTGPANATNQLLHTGDMDADGRADFVMEDDNPSGGSSCARKIKIYRNQVSGSQAIFPLLAEYCLTAVTSGPVTTFHQTVPRFSDFDGNGLPDLWVKAHGYGGAYGYDSIVFARKTGGTYTLNRVDANALFPAAPEQRQAEEFNAGDTQVVGAVEQLLDINGDGLDDLIYSRDGQWRGRLNRGGTFGPRIVFENTPGRSACAVDQFGQCRAFTQAFDYDSDGRLDLLIPRKFASRVCTYFYFPPNPPSQPQEQIYFRCPENHVTGNDNELGVMARFTSAIIGEVRGMYAAGKGSLDRSKYHADALRFVQTGPNQFRIDQTATPIILSKTDRPLDVTGDGLTDKFMGNYCSIESMAAACHIPWKAEGGQLYGPDISPLSFTDAAATGVTANAVFVNENRGAGAVNPDGATPQTPDMLSMVTDGMGVETVWTYYTLSSDAGRTVGETPLYTVPMDETSRYIDGQHFYFTSSMPVVSDMIQSDGLGDYRSWRYGYSEAMYHARGRGFQGFRTIIEEDEAAGTRTTTTFHQKFPLTSQPESIIVNSLNRSGISAPISKQAFTWRCSLTDRTSATACAPPPCTPPACTATVKFPYLDTQETWTYDAATADNPAGGAPLLVSYRKQVAADDATCAGTFPTASGYDAYGNLKASTTITSDQTGTGGYRTFVASHCVRNLAVFAAADTANWWVDKLNSRTASTKIAYDATNHALPAGAVNPVQTVATAYTWNTNRTLATETVQAGVANQQRVTTYGYPATNYGLPNSVSVAASGDPNGTRTVSTTYSTDGYFPKTVTNPLLHTVTTQTRDPDGQPDYVIDANALRTEVDYDAFGAPVTTRFLGPAGQTLAPDKHMIMAWCAVGGCIDGGLYFIRNVQDGTPTTAAVFDQLGRPLRQRTRLMDDQDSLTDTQYDAAGHVTQQSQPYRYGETIYWTQFTGYDVLGRVTQKIVPQANTDGRGNLKTTYAYSGRQTAIQVCGTADATTTGCLNLSRTTDSLGRYVETIDAKTGRTRFWYDGSGNALAIEDAKTNVIQAAYNALGQRTAVDDPNQGQWSFTYNALGEVLSQTDARGILTSMAYDKLGRPTQSSATYDIDGVAPLDTILDAFTYDPAYGKGLEGMHERKLNTVLQRRVQTVYDPLSRPITRTYDNATGTPGTFSSLTQDTVYDAYYGRPKGQGYGNGEALWLRYSAYGDLIRETDANSGADYRQVLATDARGNPTQEVLAGGNLSAFRSYQPQTGQVTAIRYASLGNANLRRLNYAYDVFGNLGEQVLDAGLSAETYHYDALHRLVNATRQGAATDAVGYAYDAVGNFQYKSDFSRTNKPGWYNYTGGLGVPACGGGPNAVKQVQLLDGSLRNYCYDANGNLTSDNAGLAMTYDHTQRATRITRSGITRTFQYDATGTRFRQSGGGEATQYFPSVERRIGPINDEKTYLGSAAVATTIAATRKVEFLLTDRLGSVDAVANDDGTLIETRGYDAFGKPRTGTWTNATPPRLGTVQNTTHGFTGHEHLDSLELIHMNGRVYDYSIGRFTGVDPVIQFPLNSQSLNPYSYILNNPLSGTDPTGYTACTTGTNIKSDSGPNCEGLGVSGGTSDKNTVEGRHPPKSRTTSNGAQGQGAGIQSNKSLSDVNGATQRPNSPVMTATPARGAVDYLKAGPVVLAGEFLLDQVGDMLGSLGPTQQSDFSGEPYKVNPFNGNAMTMGDVQAARLNLATFFMPMARVEQATAEEVKIAVTSVRNAAQGVTRDARWLELANQSNSHLPKEVIDFIRKHDGKGVYKRFGLELAHLPKRAAAQGNDFSQALPKWAADHRGIQHRYLKERATGTRISIPGRSRSGGALDLPPAGSLP